MISELLNVSPATTTYYLFNYGDTRIPKTNPEIPWNIFREYFVVKKSGFGKPNVDHLRKDAPSKTFFKILHMNLTSIKNIKWDFDHM